MRWSIVTSFGKCEEVGRIANDAFAAEPFRRMSDSRLKAFVKNLSLSEQEKSALLADLAEIEKENQINEIYSRMTDKNEKQSPAKKSTPLRKTHGGSRKKLRALGARQR